LLQHPDLAVQFHARPDFSHFVHPVEERVAGQILHLLEVSGHFPERGVVERIRIQAVLHRETGDDPQVLDRERLEGFDVGGRP
jgi:hypothetical protein